MDSTLLKGLMLLEHLAGSETPRGVSELARAEGPACAVASPRLSILSGTPDAQPEAERSVFGRTDLCAADSEILTELGLPRPPVEAPRPRHAVSASFDYRSESVPASAPDGSPHRPPRLI
ncbi:hypothetical protein [Methylobacterium oryzae]|uniref:hypothetical protein n=1 Tax=Methylobacterium oryzae TaxID=334852 RepID=UPI002F35379F